MRITPGVQTNDRRRDRAKETRAVVVREVDLRDLVETVREGLLVLDSDLTIRFANRYFCDTFAVASHLRPA